MAEEVNERIKVDLEGVGMSGSLPAEKFARSIISAAGETMRARVQTYSNYLALGQLAYTEAAAMAVIAGRSPDEITVKPAESQRVAVYASLSPAADKPIAARLTAEIWVQNELAAIEVKFVNPPPHSSRLFFLPPWALTEGAEYLTCKKTAAKIKERNICGQDA